MYWYKFAKGLMADKKIKQDDLVSVFGVKTRGAVGHYLSGRRSPSAEQLMSLATKLGVTMDELMSGEHAPEQNNVLPFVQDTALDNNIRHSHVSVRGEVPLISWVSAGVWQEAIDNFQPGDGEKMVPVTVPVGAHTFALTVSGDSMEPEFYEGDIIIIEPELDPVHRDFVIAKNGGEATFKQLWNEAGEWYLKPVNERYPIKPLGNGHIIGVVREKTKLYR